MPSPVVLGHVTERGVDTTLSGDRVTSGGEELGDTSRLQSTLGQTKRGAKTRTTGSDDDGIKLVVDDGVPLVLTKVLFSQSMVSMTFATQRRDRDRGEVRINVSRVQLTTASLARAVCEATT